VRRLPDRPYLPDVSLHKIRGCPYSAFELDRSEALCRRNQTTQSDSGRPDASPSRGRYFDGMSRSLINQYYRCFNERRFTDAAAMFADDAEVELVPGKPERGGVGYLHFAETWTAAFPHGALTVERIDQRSASVCEVYLVATGAHKGVLDFGAYRFRASGVNAVLHLRELLDIRGDKIVAAVLTLDLNDLVSQLTTIDYDELARRVDRICGLRDALAMSFGDEHGRREVAHRLGIELDAARRALRPHFYR
jgi:SnoaL-like polyketide cyclase